MIDFLIPLHVHGNSFQMSLNISNFESFVSRFNVKMYKNHSLGFIMALFYHYRHSCIYRNIFLLEFLLRTEFIVHPDARSSLPSFYQLSMNSDRDYVFHVLGTNNHSLEFTA